MSGDDIPNTARRSSRARTQAVLKGDVVTTFKAPAPIATKQQSEVETALRNNAAAQAKAKQTIADMNTWMGKPSGARLDTTAPVAQLPDTASSSFARSRREVASKAPTATPKLDRQSTPAPRSSKSLRSGSRRREVVEEEEEDYEEEEYKDSTPEIQVETKELVSVFNDSPEEPSLIGRLISGIFSKAAAAVTATVQQEESSGHISGELAESVQEKVLEKLDTEVKKVEMDTVLDNVARLSGRNTLEQAELLYLIEDLKFKVTSLEEEKGRLIQNIENQSKILEPMQRAALESDQKSRESLSRVGEITYTMEKKANEYKRVEKDLEQAVLTIVEKDVQLEALKREAAALRATIGSAKGQILSMPDDADTRILMLQAEDAETIAAARARLLQLQSIISTSPEASSRYQEIRDAINETLLQSAAEIAQLKKQVAKQKKANELQIHLAARKNEEAAKEALNQRRQILSRIGLLGLSPDSEKGIRLQRELDKVDRELGNLQQDHALYLIQIAEDRVINSLKNPRLLSAINVPVRNQPRTYGGEDAINVNRRGGYGWMTPTLLRDQGMSAPFANILLDLVTPV